MFSDPGKIFEISLGAAENGLQVWSEVPHVDSAIKNVSTSFETIKTNNYMYTPVNQVPMQYWLNFVSQQFLQFVK